MSIMGCCSSFIKCSDAMVCVHADDPYYTRCTYRHHLEAGRIFYGQNRNVFGPVISQPEYKQPISEVQNNYEVAVDHSDEAIYLHCMNRVFAIYARQKNLLSMSLNPEQIKAVEVAFDDAGIPYKPEIDDVAECIIDKPTAEDPAPANSRVVFEINGDEYHVLNYNSWLIKHSIAEKIAKAFENHYIKAKVELRGNYTSANWVNIQQITQVQHMLDTVEVKEIDKQLGLNNSNSKGTAAQVSMFEAKSEHHTKEVSTSCIDMQKKTIAAIRSPQLITQQPVSIPTELLSMYPGSCLVLADDKFNGAYLGELAKIRKMQMGYRYAHVKVFEVLRQPRQDAIFNPSATVEREPYEPGTIKTFDINDIKLIVRLEV